MSFNFSFCKPCLSLNFNAKCGNHGGAIRFPVSELSIEVALVVVIGNDETFVDVGSFIVVELVVVFVVDGNM